MHHTFAPAADRSYPDIVAGQIADNTTISDAAIHALLPLPTVPPTARNRGRPATAATPHRLHVYSADWCSRPLRRVSETVRYVDDDSARLSASSSAVDTPRGGIILFHAIHAYTRTGRHHRPLRDGLHCTQLADAAVFRPLPAAHRAHHRDLPPPVRHPAPILLVSRSSGS